MSVRGRGSSVLVLLRSGHHLSPETASCCQMHDCERWGPMSTLGRDSDLGSAGWQGWLWCEGGQGSEKGGPGKSKGITDNSL